MAPDQATNVVRVRAYFAARREAERLLTAIAAPYRGTPEGMQVTALTLCFQQCLDCGE